ncbi:hypothetical protein EVG20_g11245 [Dentipellis fragilis]|uniref:Uncharacterized protein n=1 Tax=Dentipellis fragilis TaxID=205917 RepID=A0A4Y9XMF7_9AGAM|nr:hypothetical protein EVG20_g11245 [Dentipellis fragilis]
MRRWQRVSIAWVAVQVEHVRHHASVLTAPIRHPTHPADEKIGLHVTIIHVSLFTPPPSSTESVDTALPSSPALRAERSSEWRDYVGSAAVLVQRGSGPSSGSLH